MSAQQPLELFLLQTSPSDTGAKRQLLVLARGLKRAIGLVQNVVKGAYTNFGSAALPEALSQLPDGVEGVIGELTINGLIHPPPNG
jgi:hypothetical protein